MGISSDAIAGLVGVVTGSAITGGFQYVLTARAERRDGRAARRLVHAELSTYRAALDFAAGGRALAEPLTADLGDHSRWDANADRLARDLSDDAWQAIEYVYWGMGAIVAEAEDRGCIRPHRAGYALDAVNRATKYLEPRERRLFGTHRGHADKADDAGDEESGT